MTKKILAYVLVVVILVLAGYAFYKMKGGNALSSERAASLDIAEYSVEGQVVSIGKDSLVISTGRVERTAEGNQFVSYERTVRLADTIQFSENAQKSEMGVAKLLQTVKVKDRVVFYGSGSANSLTEGDFTANRVDLISRGTTPAALPPGGSN